MLSLWIYGYVWIFIIVRLDCKVSRVCYSTQRAEPKCVNHTLQCRHDSVITITSARYYYINRNFKNDKRCRCGSVQCDVCTGGSKYKSKVQCKRQHRNVDYGKLVSICSNQRNCSVPVPSQQTHKCGVSKPQLQASYSRIGYSCFQDHESTSTTISTTNAPTTAVLSSSQSHSLMKAAQITNKSPQTEHTQAGSKAAPIAGGGVGGVVVIAAIAVLVIYCRRRKKSTECPDESNKGRNNPVMENESIYSIAGDTQGADAQVNNNVGFGEIVESCEQTYFQIEPQNNNPEYMNVDVSPNERYDHVTMAINSSPLDTSKDKTESVEDNCYNHLGTDVQKVVCDYDTAASASKAVKYQDDYSYDRLGASTGTTVTENDYDTTVPEC